MINLSKAAAYATYDLYPSEAPDNCLRLLSGFMSCGDSPMSCIAKYLAATTAVLLSVGTPVFSSAQTFAAGQNRTLLDHENANGPGDGHTFARHVGKSYEYMRGRCTSEGLAEVSSFTSLPAADSLVRSALAARASQIDAWLASITEPTAIIRYWVADRAPTGQYYRCAGMIPWIPRGVRVVLARNPRLPGGWYVRSAFPYALGPTG